jgi:hypothetical protein
MVQVEHHMIQMERMGMMTTMAETLDEDRQLVVTTIPIDGADPLAVFYKAKYINKCNFWWCTLPQGPGVPVSPETILRSGQQLSAWILKPHTFLM